MTICLTTPRSIDARYLPGVVPAGARNATALIIQGELARRISELKSTTDWETKFEKLSASGGSVLLMVARALS